MSTGTVVLDVRAYMECSEDRCDARLGVDLILTLMGGFVFRPPKGHGWQIQQGERDPVYECRCPSHHSKIERLTNADPGILKLGDVLAKAHKH